MSEAGAQVPSPGDTQYRALFETMALGVVFRDRDGQVIEANPAACSILGLTREELLGSTPVDPRWNSIRTNGEPYPEAEYPGMIALRTGRPVHGAVMGVRDPRRDEVRWILIDSLPECRDGEAAPCRAYSTFSDVTELRRATRAVAASEETFRSIIESTPMGMHFYRLEEGDRLVFTGANPAASRILGVDAQTFVGMTIEEAFPPLAETEVPAMYRRACRTGEPWQTQQIEYDHAEIRGAYEVYAFRTRPGSMAVMFLDTTERTRMQEELRESERWHRAMFEAAGDAIFVMRRDRFIDCNPAAERIFGRSREDLLACSPADVSPPTQRNGRSTEDLQAEYLERAYAGEALTFDWIHTRKDGEPFDVQVTLTEVKLGSESVILAHLRDQTAERELEERIAQMQRMETVGQLAGGVAHDFNNLLAPMLGYSEELLEDLGPDSPHGRPLKAIRGAAEAARTLTRQLLALSRKQVLDIRSLDLNEVVRAFQKILRRTIREDVEIRLAYAPEPTHILGDLHQIEQILLNLAMNASDAMAGPGTLTIETANVEPDAPFFEDHPELVQGPLVRLAVTDTGAGMDRPTMRRIFEPFFTTKEKGKGTGLGLSTVYGIVSQHHGTVLVDSRPGAGTRIEVLLPCIADAEEDFDNSYELDTGGEGSETVVVVEDDEHVRELVCTMLRRRGYEVLTTPSAYACIELLEGLDEPVDLLLTDVIMPELNGPRLYETLARRRPGLRVLYMSGYTDDMIKDHGVLRSSVQLLVKPFTARDLTRKVREVLALSPPDAGDTAADRRAGPEPRL